MTRPIVRIVALALLWLMLARMLHAATALSPVVDEQSHISRGLSVLRTGDHRLTIGHPLGLNAWVALPLAGDPTVRLPLADASWATAAWDRFGDQFLWQVNARPEGIVFRSRVMVMLLALVLGALVFRWSADRAGGAGGLLGLALFTFDPNVLAHGMLATTDLGATLFMFATTYALWRAVLQGRRAWLLATGLLLGLALVSKHSSLMLLPIFAVTLTAVAVARHRRGAARRGPPGSSATSARRIAAATVLVLGVSLLVLLATYVGRVDAYVRDLWFLVTDTRRHPAFLLGKRSADGFWAYFPVAFAVKTPLPALILFTLGLLACLRRRRPADLFLLLPPVLYFGLSMASGFNIGYRHLLPVLPYLMVVASGAVVLPVRPPALRTGTVALLVAWLVWTSARVHPNYLTSFNELSPKPSWNVLVDSNLDWGQGLAQLADYLAGHDIGRVKLSSFGPGDPVRYGIGYDPLPRWPPPAPTDFRPANPAPGVYAIGATNLQGVLLPDPDAFDWFRRRAPDDVVAGSILIYDVPPDPAPPRAVGLCRQPWTPLEPADLPAVLGSGRRRVVRFDCADAWWWSGGPTWYLLPRQGVDGPFGRLEYANPVFGLTRQVQAPAPEHPLPDLARFEGGLTLLGYDVTPPLRAGQTFELASIWRVDGPVAPPVSLFAHLLDAQGEMVAGADGLGVPAEHLQAGDILRQTHRFSVPAGAPPGDYRVELGFYRLDTMQRYTVSAGDQPTADRTLTAPLALDR